MNKDSKIPSGNRVTMRTAPAIDATHQIARLRAQIKSIPQGRFALSLSEVAAILQCSYHVIRRMEKKGRIRFIDMSPSDDPLHRRLLRAPVESVREYLKEQISEIEKHVGIAPAGAGESAGNQKERKGAACPKKS